MSSKKQPFLRKSEFFYPHAPKKKARFRGISPARGNTFVFRPSSPRSPAQNGHCWPLSACPKKASWVISKEIHHPTDETISIVHQKSAQKHDFTPSVNTISGEQLLLHLFFSPADPPSEVLKPKNRDCDRRIGCL
jgi:hypothetical protein